MLQRLLDLLNEHPETLSQEKICAELGITPSSLQALLDILVRKGRLAQNPLGTPNCEGDCRSCPALDRCSITRTSIETIYRLNS